MTVRGSCSRASLREIWVGDRGLPFAGKLDILISERF